MLPMINLKLTPIAVLSRHFALRKRRKAAVKRNHCQNGLHRENSFQFQRSIYKQLWCMWSTALPHNRSTLRSLLHAQNKEPNPLATPFDNTTKLLDLELYFHRNKSSWKV